MASKKITAMPDWAGVQVPTDLFTGVDLSQPAATQNVKSTLNDVFQEITKNITDLSVQFISGDGVSTVSAASKGKIRYSSAAASAAGSFQVSESGGAYQNLIKGPASAGNLTANLLPFATAADVVGDTALAQLGSTTTRTLNFNPFTPGTSLSSYSAIRVGVFDSGGFQTLGLLGLSPTILGIYFGGTLAAPTSPAVNNQLLGISASAQYNTTPGNISAGGSIQVYATETWSGSLAGAGMVFRTALNGSAPGNQIATLAINQLGCVHVRPSLSSGAISSSGTATIFQVGGNGATIDNLAISFFCDIGNSGLATTKTVVLQRKANQSGALLETQSASGVGQFSIVPQAGVENHFFNWVGSANAPAVSVAGSARIYVDSGGLVEISQNGGAYSPIATAATSAPGGASGDYQINNAGAFGAGVIAQGAAGRVTVSPTAVSSGVTAYLTVTAPADTGLTASTEAIGINFNASATRQHATGALATQREFVFQAPTYSFVGASTITTAATLAITGAPAAGTNATLTNSYALHAPSGASRLDTLQLSDGTASVPAVGRAAGSTGFYFGTEFVVFTAATEPKFFFERAANNQFNLASNVKIGWTSTTNVISVVSDIGIGRQAAGVLRVTDGSGTTGAGAGQLLVASSGTTAAAQLHVLSAAAARIAGIFDTAASPSQPALSLRLNGTEFAAFSERSTFNRVAIAAPGSPSNGDSWRDSTQKAIAYRESGITTFGPQTLFSATATGQVANTTTETTLLGSGIGNKTLPANFFAPGKTVRLTLRGVYSTAVAPGTLNVKAKFGSTTIAQTTALTPAGTVTDLYWEVVVDITCRTTGGAGTVFAEGRFNHQDDTTTRGEFVWGMVNTATVTIDTTASQVIDVTATWATASASNDLRCTIVTIEALN